MAREILNEFESHKPLVSAAVKIDYVFAYAPRDKHGFPSGPALKLNGLAADGIARILPPKQRALGRGDAEISLDGDYWREASHEERRALLDHELHHLQVRMQNGLPVRDNLSRPKLKMRRHDVDVGWFVVIAERHGMASGEQRQAKEIQERFGQYLWPDLAVGHR